MPSWPTWAAMAGGHNRRGPTWGVGHARRSWNAVRDDYPRPSLTGNTACASPSPTSQRPTCPFSFAPGGTPPARPSATSAPARCEPVPAFLLLPGPSTCPAWPSAAPASARSEPVPAFPLLPGPPTCPAKPSAAPVASRCEPFPTNRLTPSSRDSGSWPGRDCRREFRQARSRTPPPDSVLAVVGMTDGVWQGGSVISTLRRGPCRASRHDRGLRNSPCAPPCACCRRRP